MSFIFSHGSPSKQGSGSPAICFAGAAVAGAALAAGAMLLVSRKRAGKKAEEKNIYESVRRLGSVGWPKSVRLVQRSVLCLDDLSVE